MANIDKGFTLGEWIEFKPFNQGITDEQSAHLMEKGRALCNLCETLKVPSVVYYTESYKDGVYVTDGHRVMGPKSRVTPEFVAIDRIMSDGLDAFITTHSDLHVCRMAEKKCGHSNIDLEMVGSYTFKEWSECGLDEFELEKEAVNIILHGASELVDLALEYNTVMACYVMTGNHSVNGMWETSMLRNTVFLNLGLMPAELLACDYILRNGVMDFTEGLLGQDLLNASRIRHEKV